MRLRFFLPLVLSGSLALAQDAGMQAAQMAAQASQQAMQDAMMANQQAMQDAQIANQQAMQASQEAMQNSDSGVYGMPMAATPKLSMKAGTYPAAITVRMKDKTRGAVMYYTTDGWTPTAQSTRYVGPIQITSTTHLQVIAVAPYCMRSQIATATYILPGTTEASATDAEKSGGQSQVESTGTPQHLVLPKGAKVPLMVTADVTSNKLEIGDTIPLALAQDLEVDGVVVAKKGTPADATVIQVDGAGLVGQPGSITFAVHSLDVPGNVIPLDGTETKEGQNKYKTVRSVAIVPFV
ncbi:MAG TPA: chitobiase/beta-hexosaminidase C-terminal domain-containing protein, partial [Acidobacteriaceae bacterium]|nr:chitobiase/beta-hexosaminidase C-terminal domain-containing protein [Acidobacteriaceae bacterium]